MSYKDYIFITGSNVPRAVILSLPRLWSYWKNQVSTKSCNILMMQNIVKGTIETIFTEKPSLHIRINNNRTYLADLKEIWILCWVTEKRLFMYVSLTDSNNSFQIMRLFKSRWPVNSPHKRSITLEMFPFDDVIRHSVGHISSQWDTRVQHTRARGLPNKASRAHLNWKWKYKHSFIRFNSATAKAMSSKTSN